jgi:hypothetical protein
MSFTILGAFLSVFQTKKYLILLFLAPALNSGRLLKKNLKLVLKHIKHCFIWAIFKSSNGVLNRSNRNCLFRPGIDGKIFALKIKRTKAKLLMLTIAFYSICYLFVILPLSYCTLSSGPVKLRDIHKYLLSQGC